MDWFRMYGEMPSDPKIGTLNDAQFRTWVELLCVACKSEDHGNTHLTDETINWALRRNVTETLHELLHRKLVTKNNEGEYVIPAWEKRQCKSDSSAIRVKKHRDKKNNINNLSQCNVTETLQKQECNGLEKRREEKNIDIELDKSISISAHPEKKSCFEEFWEAYPNKTGKKPCLEKWKRRKLDEKADEIIADVRQKTLNDERWLSGFIPNPETYLNQERWNDPVKFRDNHARGSPQAVQPKSVQAFMALENMKNANKTTCGTVVSGLDSGGVAKIALLGA